jgi:serine/threonine protein kinase
VEVNTLSRLRHRNIVRLLGVCVEGDQRIAVFELLSRGSLSGALHQAKEEPLGSRTGSSGAAAPHRRPRQVLPWQERMQIALGIAKGLAHMHEVALSAFACFFLAVACV